MTPIDITTPGGRLKYLINSLNISQSDFAASLMRNKVDISRYVNNKNRLNSKLLKEIKEKYPAVNTAWLVFNSGDSGIDTETKTAKEVAYIEKISNLEAEIERLNTEIKQIKLLIK